MSSEGSVSIVMHHGDPKIESSTRALTVSEYAELNSFFVKHPDGKISQGIVPLSFRPFLPTHVQYALSKAPRVSIHILHADFYFPP